MSTLRPLRLGLLSTTPPDHRGSMSRYAHLVEHALDTVNAEKRIAVSIIQLALPKKRLSHVPGVLRTWVNHFWIAAAARIQFSKSNYDLIHILDGSHAYIVNFLSRIPTVVTVHDLIPLRQIHHHFPVNPPNPLAAWLIGKSVNGLAQSDHLISVSRSTATDLAEMADIEPRKISIIHLAVSPTIIPKNQDGCTRPWIKRRYSQNAYILHVGNSAFYKNQIGVVRVFARIKAIIDVRLKLVGNPSATVRKLIMRLHLSDSVDLIVNPDDEQMKHLYGYASLFLFPSLYEGFGWPILEAMICGCPVVCSDSGALPEVAGDAALLSQPEAEEKIAKQCLTVLQSEAVAESLVAKGYRQVQRFSLNKMAEKLVKVYTAVARNDDMPKTFSFAR